MSVSPPPTAQHFPPRRVITLGVLFALSCMMLSATLAMQTRWLGAGFAAHEEGLIVTTIQRDGPAQDRLHIGDIVTAVAGPDTTPFALHALDIMEDPYDLQLYREFNDFFNRQSAIYNRLQQPTTLFILADGREIPIQTATHRPLSSLSFSFWFQLACGFISLLIGVSIYAFRQDEVAPRCFAISSIGLMAIITAALVTRLWSANPQ